MARFDELEQFLRKQEMAVVNTADTQRAHREASRDIHDPMIRKTFDIVGEWFKTIIAPRTDIHLVLKRREKPEGHDDLLDTSLYRYRANFVPRTPPSRISSFADTYRQPGETEGSRDWHPNVAFQFNVALYPRFDPDQRKYTDDLETRIGMQTWDSTDIEMARKIADSASVADMGWERIGTSLLILPEEKPLGKVEKQIADSLALLTPNVLNHSSFWRY